MINEREKKYSNSLNGLTGKGMRIALLEYYASDLFYQFNISNKLNMFCGDPTNIMGEGPGDNHVYKNGGILRDMLPEAVIDYFPQNNEGLKAAIAGNYDILSFSGGQCFADDELEKELAKKTFITVAVGNDYGKGEGLGNTIFMPARSEWWCPIGAAHLNAYGEPVPMMADYSSYGNFTVRLVSFSNIQYKEGSPKIMGTSHSTPFAVGLLGLFGQAFKNKFGTKPTPKEYNNFLERNTYSIDPTRLKDGEGLLILPNFDTYDFGVEVKAGSKVMNDNGEVKEMLAPVIAFKRGVPIMPTEDMVDRTYIPTTSLREMGFVVEYHADKKSVIVSKPLQEKEY